MIPVLIFAVIALMVLGILVQRAHRANRVRMVTCVIRPEQLDDVVKALKKDSLMMGMTVLNVRGIGRQFAEKVEAEERKSIKFLPKLKLEILVRQVDVERTMNAIVGALRTGNIGDGKIVVYDAASAMRIRTGERGLSAL